MATRAGARPSLRQRALRWMRPPRRLSFTREGRWVVFLAIAIGVAALNTGNNLLYLLLSWLLSFIIASGVLSEITMRRLHVTRRPPPQVFADQPFLMEIAVENRKAETASYSIEIEDMFAGKPLDKKCYFLKIPAGRTQRTSYRHSFPRRGLYRFDGFRLATRFPFTLFRKSRDLEAASEVVVFPRIAPVHRPPPRPRGAGVGASQRLGRRGEFFGLREWREGDDRRDIHWRSSARAGRMMVRELQDELERQVTIAVDNAVPDAIASAIAVGGSAPETERCLDALERVMSTAAGLASTYLDAGWAVGLAARGARVPVAVGKPQLARILRELALLPAARGDVPIAGLDDRHDRVLVVAPELPAPPRPAVDHVIEA